MAKGPFAIVGIGCRFPGGASSPTRFWSNLIAGKDAIVDVPPERWDMARFYDPEIGAPGKLYARQGGFLEEPIDTFDPGLFGITPREAAVLDPQQRLLHETLWEAFEDGGIDPSRLRGSNTGVFVGGFTLDHMITQLGAHARDAIFSNTATSATMVMLSNRLSYTFDLRGPSISVDTACSSSLVATHLGCQSLAAGECDLAVVAGVNIMTRPEYSITMCKGGFLSPTSRCRAFDRAADGYVRGEGAGVVLLRRLADAEAAGDHIYAVIHATGVNQDGKSSGLTAPNPAAQRALVAEVCALAGVQPRDIDVIEAHGTGTQAGDPVEAGSLGTVLGKERSQPVWIGSVKTNIGHLEAGAGVAGLIKLALTLHHREVPPSLHFHGPHDKIDFDALKLRVPTSPEALPRDRTVYGVANSFGYGGTNANVVLSSFGPASHTRSGIETTERIGVTELGARALPLSAHTDVALRARATALLDDTRDSDLLGAGPTLALGRQHLAHRALLFGKDDAELRAALSALSEGAPHARLALGRGQAGLRPVFVFTGMGTQWWGMGEELFARAPRFRETVLACDEVWRRLGGETLVPWFESDASRSAHGLGRRGEAIDEPAFAQPGNVVMQVALTETWRALGVVPHAVVGHSVGEIGAAYAAGALSLDQVMTLVFHRSRLQQRLVGRGGMLAVGLGRDAIQPVLEEVGGGLVIAADNAPSSVTLAGSHDALAAIAARLDERGIFQRKLRVAVPYHSPLMDELEPDFRAALSSLSPLPPGVPLYSTLLGARVTHAAHDADYWWRNAAERVSLRETLALMASDGWDCFVEIGPHPVLGPSIAEVVGAHGARVTLRHSQKRDVDNHAELTRQLAALYTDGAEIDWRAFWAPGEPIRLPAYPYQRERFWHETPEAALDRVGAPRAPRLLQRRQRSPEPCWISELGRTAFPWLDDHRVDGLVVFPGAGYIATALDAASTLERPLVLEGLRLERPLMLEGPVEIRVELHGRELAFASRKHEPDATWRTHARTRLVESPRPVANRIDASVLEGAGATSADSLYEVLRRRGLEYGPAFRGILSVRAQRGVFEATLELPADVAERDAWSVHPALLDASFQAFLAAATSSSQRPLVPTRVEEVRLHQRVRGAVTARGTVRLQTEVALVGDIELYDATGACVLELRGLRCQALAGAEERASAGWLYVDGWTRGEPVAAVSARGRWVCLTQTSALGERARAALSAAGASASCRAVDAESLDRTLADALETPAAGLVLAYAAGPDDEAGTRATGLLLSTLKKLARMSSRPSRIVVLTSRAQAVLAGEAPEVGNAALFGLTRVAQNELARLAIVLVDAAPDIDPRVLERVLTSSDEETEWAIRGSEAYVRRLERCGVEPVPEIAPPGTPGRLVVERPGALDSLAWISTARRAPGPREIEVQVLGAPLNFKDYIKAMGVLPASYLEATYYEDALGLEAAGVVVRVGEGVTEWKPGDEVAIPARSGSMRSYVTDGIHYVVSKPPHHSFEEAACYCNFVTAHYGLADLGRLSPGESVLIHSGAGGVGLAALQVARSRGARVFATAGTDRKREHLRTLGVEHVYDSRSLAFADEVLRETNGRGVDVVLNSQAGDIMLRSIDVMAPYGRFIEIGKRAIHDFHALQLSAFDRNLLFAAIDVDRMMADNPKLYRRLLDEVHALFCDRTYEALSATVHDGQDAETAFRELGRSQHIGKIALRMSHDLVVRRDPRERAAVRPDRRYLITGGFGGFGQSLARWLVEQGARHLVLVSRSGAAGDDANALVRALEAQGAIVEAPRVDVSDGAAVQALVAGFAEGPPLAGVFHTAMVLDDGALEDLDDARLARVMGPKAEGALHLDRAVASLDLDHFVLFSSVSAVTGNPGQGSYVAANAVLDALAHRRRAAGKAALSVDWGVLDEVGVVARNAEVGEHLARLGMRAISPSHALESLREAMTLGRPQIGIFDIDWRTWSAASGQSGQPRFSSLAARQGRSSEHPLARELQALDHEGRLAYVRERLVARLSRVMQIPPEKVDTELSLDNMGVDSLMAVEVQSGVRADLHVELPTVLLMQGPSVEELCRRALDQILDEGVEDADVDEMSEEELDALLAAELSTS